MWVGLCGQSGVGKGYVASVFAKNGILSIDTDAVYRTLTGPANPRTPCMDAICAYFGADAAQSDGSLNRPYMRSQVLGANNHGRLEKLNQITHTFILRETEVCAEMLYHQGSDFILIDAPVLYESGFDRYCGAVICVIAPRKVQLDRIQRRDGISLESAMIRLEAQMPVDELIKRADYVLVNDGCADILETQVREIIRSLYQRFPVKARET